MGMGDTGLPRDLAELLPAERRAYLSRLAEALDGAALTECGVENLYRVFSVMRLDHFERLQFLRSIAVGRPFTSKAKLPADRIVKLALARDILSVTDGGEGTAARAVLSRFGLTTEQRDLLAEHVRWGRDILGRIARADASLRSDEMPVQIMKRGAAMGIPVSALYLSGSAVGISTDSPLTMRGASRDAIVLGLDPLTSGIAAPIVAGIEVRQILDAVDKKPRASRRREEALLQLCDRHARFVSFLAEDAGALEARLWERLRGHSDRIASLAHLLQRLHTKTHDAA